MARKTMNLKVEVVWPEDPEAVLEIEKRKAQWIFDRQRERFGDEALSIVYPIFIRTKELEETGLGYEEAKQIAIKEYRERQRA
ncbi:hypothetical protein [Romboutsia sp. 1001713B170207_170306_H8]|uniref:hypothetical protein n=1 Tax=Romboutsia sp. 1001713B170207_170306_H8 TaxID=2787112 RepID=UPI00189A9F66|nr:hypothetical protein [Romboutsia sp. 1001713B170207_170306_H8]